jgi:hypothetical protein
MRTHIKVVGWIHICFSILKLLGAVGIMFGGLLGGFFSGSLSTFMISGATGVAMAIVFGIIALFGLIAGFAFLSYRPWARYLLILVSVLGLFSFPWGTIFSIYSLWVLFHSETVMLFKAQERMA